MLTTPRGIGADVWVFVLEGMSGVLVARPDLACVLTANPGVSGRTEQVVAV